MEPPSYMRSAVDRNVVMRRIPVFLLHTTGFNTQKFHVLFTQRIAYVLSASQDSDYSPI